MADEKQTPEQEQLRSTARLEAFSDAVFGIAITLLVLDIRLPEGTDTAKAGTLFPALLALWPVYLAYITSFLIIGVMWANHHDLFRVIRRVDRWLLFLNLLLLVTVTFLNFPTVVVDDYIQQPDAKIAAAFYSGTMVVISLLFNAIWRYANARPHLLRENYSPTVGKTLTREYLLAPIVFLVATLLALINGILSISVCFAVMLFFAFPVRWGSRS